MVRLGAGRIALLAGMVLAVFGLWSCAPMEPDLMPAAGEEEPVRLTIWHNWVGRDGKAIAMRGILDTFRAENPGVLLEDRGFPTDVLRTQLRTSAAADEVPDLFVMFPNVMTREMATAGLIQPIGPFLDAHPDWRDGFQPGALDGFAVDGAIYAVPMSLAPTSFLYYNQALFDKHGAPPPDSWDNLFAAAERFQERHIIPVALGNKANWVVQSTIFSTLADRVTGTDWFVSAVRQDGASFTDPVFLEALEKLRELSDAGLFQPGFGRIDENQMAQLYIDGKAAMFINGGWALSNLVQNAPDELLAHTRIAILPPLENGRGKTNAVSGVVGTGLGISSKLDGAALEAALDLLYALAGPEGQRATLESSTLISYRIEPDPDKSHPLFLELHRLMQTVELVPVYDSALSPEATAAINEGLQELLLGGDAMEIAGRIQAAQEAAVRRGWP